jgi:tetratricopeptide (TPR) repeat protein
MKNLILILISVLMAAFGLLAISTSGYEYAAEKLFYRAMRINKKIALNPDVAPPAMLASLENSLQRLLKSYPESNIARTARLSLAEVYFSNKKYQPALSVLDEVILKQGRDKITLSQAQFLKGRIYEEQNQWDKALKEYVILRDKYTETPLGVQVPLYIGSYYASIKAFTKAREAFNQALLFYEKLERENKGRMLGYASANMLMAAHMELGQYEQAGRVLEETINDYPHNMLTLAQDAVNIDLIFVQKLNNPEKAIEIYNNIKAKLADKRLIEALDRKIEALQAKK